jgi:hypothetical protein
MLAFSDESLCRVMIAAIAGLALTASASAQPLPQPKPLGPGGSCPHGYTSSGSFQGAQDAIAKPPNGTCPWGYMSSGSFCLRSGSGGRPTPAYPRAPTVPAQRSRGYRSKGGDLGGDWSRTGLC